MLDYFEEDPDEDGTIVRLLPNEDDEEEWSEIDEKQAEEELERIRMTQQQLVAGNLVTLTDKVSHNLFCQNLNAWSELLNHKTTLSVIETEPRTIDTMTGRRVVNKQIAETTIKLGIEKAIDDCTKQAILTAPLNNFDKAVLEACATHQYNGESAITVKAIFKYISGGSTDLTPTMRKAIIYSIDKLRNIDVTIYATAAYTKLRRLQKPNGKPKQKPDTNGKITLVNHLLPSKRIEVEINGQFTDGIKFLDVSPVFCYASDKGETVTLAKKLLNAPKIRNTEILIQLKKYILTRITTIKRSIKGGGRGLYPTLLFKSIYNNCTNSEKMLKDKEFRKRVRESSMKYLEFLKTEKEIKNFKSVDDNGIPHVNLAKCTKFIVEI